jgi:hypothetical protein
MPYDESKKIFNYENLQNGKLYAVVDLVYAGVNQKVCAEDKVAWKSLIRSYVKVLSLLCLPREYEGDEIAELKNACDEFGYALVMKCGGSTNVTNYFHDIISGHATELCKEYGNIHRLRNEQVELFNAITSRRRNCFSNNGGAKRTKAGEEKQKFHSVESLGNWCLRTAVWETSLSAEVYSSSSYMCKSESVSFCEDLAKHIADDLGEEDNEYTLDRPWVCYDSNEDSDSDYGYESENLNDFETLLPSANDAQNIVTGQRRTSTTQIPRTCPPTPTPTPIDTLI